MALLISPMIVPLVITASGLFFFFSSVGLAKTYLGIILAHAALGTPFVIITVTATLSGFDQSPDPGQREYGGGADPYLLQGANAIDSAWGHFRGAFCLYHEL